MNTVIAQERRRKYYIIWIGKIDLGRLMNRKLDTSTSADRLKAKV